VSRGEGKRWRIFAHGHCSLIVHAFFLIPLFIAILLEKGILNSVEERREEVKDVGKCSF
jgi:hypothetical protein